MSSAFVFDNSYIIWDDKQKNNQWVCFQSKKNIEKPETAIIKIAAETKYWLWINEELVVFEGGLNRESLEGSGYYDEIDISKYLISGENTFAFLVWFWGNEGRNNTNSGMAGLLFHCTEIGLYSDENTLVFEHPAYGVTKEPFPSYLYGGHNIGFDANKDNGEFYLASFNSSDWKNATIMGKVPDKHWGTLYKRPIPQIRFSELKNYKNITRTDNFVTAELPYACHLTPYFKINAPDGLTIDIRTDRYTINGGPSDEKNSYNGHRVEYTTKNGEQEFEALNWIFGEKIYYSIPKEIEIIELKYRESGYDVDFSGNFECDNENINKLLEKCKRTLYVCMRDNYMDCPDRERGQWIGDVSSQIPQTFYCLDRNADFLSKKAIMDFINLKKGNILVGNVPGAHFHEYPSQSLNAISDIGLIMSYYLYSNDSSVISKSYEAAKEYLLLWEMGEDGLVCKRTNGCFWFDHLENVDERILENCWYYSALTAAIKMAELTNNMTDIEPFDKRRQSIKAHFDKEFRKEDGYRSIEICDDRANALAVLCGLASKDMHDKIISILENTYFSTPYMEYYVLEALMQLGASKIAFDRILKRYLPLIENENSTLWEDFSILGTKNHAWSGGPLTIMYKYGAGIMPLEPGFERVSVLPNNLGLKKILSQVLTVKGYINVEVMYQEDKFSLYVNIPSGMSGIIGVPADCFDGVPIKKIIHNGNSVLGETFGAHIVIEVSGGEHLMEAFTIV